MKTYSRSWLLVLCVALVLLNTGSLLGSWRLTQEAAAARQQAAAWKTYALTAHGRGGWAVDVELDVQSTASTEEPLPRLSF
jgi:hypothetical protein